MRPSSDHDSRIRGNLPSGGRILVIDDQPSMRRVCEFALRGDGLVADGETSPIRALARLAEGEHFDAILLDHAMPEMEGIVLLRALESVTGHGPVVFASAHADGAIAREAMGHGVWDFLAKPFTPVGLRRAIRRILMRANAVAQGDRRALALLHANRREFALARRAIEASARSEDMLLLGLLLDIQGMRDGAERCFSACGWPLNWARGGPDIWGLLAQQLDV
ncbi:MAG: response regulator [Opitutaceae bacterium]|nr:response regulator [Opitutaceae bacterium]